MKLSFRLGPRMSGHTAKEVPQREVRAPSSCTHFSAQAWSGAEEESSPMSQSSIPKSLNKVPMAQCATRRTSSLGLFRARICSWASEAHPGPGLSHVPERWRSRPGDLAPPSTTVLPGPDRATPEHAPPPGTSLAGHRLLLPVPRSRRAVPSSRAPSSVTENPQAEWAMTRGAPQSP